MDGEERVADVKTAQLSLSTYALPPRGRAPPARLTTPGAALEERVRLEHRVLVAKAERLDGKWSGAYDGSGPVRKKLLSLGPLRPKEAVRGEKHATPTLMLAVGPWGDSSADTSVLLDMCAESMCKAVCEGLSTVDASEHLSVVKAHVRARIGMMFTREAARVRVDMGAELARGRAISEKDAPALPMPDFFDEDDDL